VMDRLLLMIWPAELLLLLMVFLEVCCLPIINPPQSAIWECTTLLNVQLL
jgi:hypothetical protein